MTRKKQERLAIPAPTDAELEVLRALWERGPSTVREVYASITANKPVGYTTVLKQMQVMYRKGLLLRSERFRSHVYEPRQPQAQTLRQLTQALLQQAFGGSARALLQSALGIRRVTPKELIEIRQLLDEHERSK